MDKNKFKKFNFNIFQWNSQSLRPKMACFENLLLQEKIHIAGVCETWLEPGAGIKATNYDIFRRERHDSYGGIAVFIHKSVKAQLVCTNCSHPDIDLLHVKIFNCSDIENIVIVYCPPTTRTSVQDWLNIFSIAYKKTLILGDFNGHHTNWSLKVDQRGSQIYEALVESNLITYLKSLLSD